MRLPPSFQRALVTLFIFLFLGQWLSLGFLLVLAKLWPELVSVQALFLTSMFPHLLTAGLFIAWSFVKGSALFKDTMTRSTLCYALAYFFYAIWALSPLEPHHAFFLYLLFLLAGLVSGILCGVMLHYALHFIDRLSSMPAVSRAAENVAPFSWRTYRLTLRWHIVMVLLFALAGPPLAGMLLFFTTSRYLIDFDSLLFLYSYGILPALLTGLSFGIWIRWQPSQYVWMPLIRGGVCAGISCAFLAYLFALWRGEETILLLPIFLLAAIPAGIGCAALSYGVLWTFRTRLG